MSRLQENDRVELLDEDSEEKATLSNVIDGSLAEEHANSLDDETEDDITEEIVSRLDQVEKRLKEKEKAAEEALRQEERRRAAELSAGSKKSSSLQGDKKSLNRRRKKDLNNDSSTEEPDRSASAQPWSSEPFTQQQRALTALGVGVVFTFLYHYTRWFDQVGAGMAYLSIWVPLLYFTAQNYDPEKLLQNLKQSAFGREDPQTGSTQEEAVRNKKEH